MPSAHVVERSTVVPQPPREVYAWHERPGAFERLTPPWEHVEVLERSGGLERGARTVVRVRIGGRWVRWVAVHGEHVPDRRFVDEQMVGPFARWQHVHEFTPVGAGTRITDRVEYVPPLGPVGAAGDWLVRRRLERLLAYRHSVLGGDLAAHARFREQPRLRVAITGVTGLIGRSLKAFLTSGGHEVIGIVRGTPGRGEVRWDPDAGLIDPGGLEGVDAVVHLAGENVGSGRWTAARKRRIVASRTASTGLLAATLARLSPPPRVLVSASAVGIYGPRGDEVLTETSELGPESDFFARLARVWEAAAEPALAAGIRVVHPRFGVVLSPGGGALAKLLPPFRAGLGGPLGNGRMWMSWISIDDAVTAIDYALHAELAGACNVVAPAPVANREFTRVLARVLRRPAVVRVPAGALKLAIGEMADATILASIRVVPKLLEQRGFAFRHPDLETALRYLLGRSP
jgi:uncharacterized protein (TIGR01777 family)